MGKAALEGHPTGEGRMKVKHPAIGSLSDGRVCVDVRGVGYPESRRPIRYSVPAPVPSSFPRRLRVLAGAALALGIGLLMVGVMSLFLC